MRKVYFFTILLFFLSSINSHAQTWHSTWFTDKAASLDNANLREVFFLDNLNGWAGGLFGELYKTTDGGATWITLPSGTTEDLQSFFIGLLSGFELGTNKIS